MALSRLSVLLAAVLALAHVSCAADTVSVVQVPAPGITTIVNASDGIMFYIYVTKIGVTDSTGQGSDIGCQALVGTVTTFGGSWGSQSWIMMSYDGDEGDADRWALRFTPAIGKYEVAMHCWDYSGHDAWGTSYGSNARLQAVGCGDWSVQADLGEECDAGAANAYGCTDKCKCEPGHVASPTGAYWGCKQTKPLPTEQGSIWKSRSVYQVLTDRFAWNHDDRATSCNVSKNTYCGGTFTGIKNHLDYITGMGFDAIWISPVVENTPNGFHGYWAKNFRKINTNFGDMSDLRSLVTACHEAGVLVMLDWVSNHVGPVSYNYSTIDTFDDAEFYHSCSSCPSGCSIEDYTDMTQTEICRLSGLPDLNTSNSVVAQKLHKFASEIIKKSGVDALRIDTVPHVNLLYWEDFRAGIDKFMIGEVFDSRPERGAAFQNPLDSVLWYPIYYAARNVFAYQQNASKLDDVLQASRASFLDTTVLGRFVDNHDNVRFLNVQPDKALYKNALAFTILGEGIPIIYYGSEQGFDGGADPYNREALWQSGFKKSADLYHFIKKLNVARKLSMAFNYVQTTLATDANLYVFSRGPLLAFLRNEGSSAANRTVTVSLPAHSNPSGLVDVFANSEASLHVESGVTTVTVTLPAGGAPVVLYHV